MIRHYQLSIDAERGEPVDVVLWSLGASGNVVGLVEHEAFGPFDDVYDIAAWVEKRMRVELGHYLG